MCGKYGKIFVTRLFSFFFHNVFYLTLSKTNLIDLASFNILNANAFQLIYPYKFNLTYFYIKQHQSMTRWKIQGPYSLTILFILLWLFQKKNVSQLLTYSLANQKLFYFQMLLITGKDLGPYLSTIIQNVLCPILQVFLFLAAFEYNITCADPDIFLRRGPTENANCLII